MSGQWEVVGSKKNKQSKLPVPKGTDKQANKKKNVLNGVKIEEVLPKSQVQNLYGNVKNKESEKPKEKSKNQEAKKPQKKVEKPQEPPKPKLPKSVESALNSINVEDFSSIYEKTKTLYPEAPIVWLKELVQYLNQKIPIELNDPVFTNRSQGYPFNIIPSPLKAVIEKSIKEAGKGNVQLFFDIALTSMATEMGKGLPALGWKFYLQYIASNEPKSIAANINKHITLEKSYQNRSNIGLSILWAVGQIGFSDFHSGLTVFQELMLPLMEMKNYSRFIVKYLLDLITGHKELSLTKDEYLLIVDTVYSNKKNFPNDLRDSLSSELDKVKNSLFSKNNKEKYHGFVDVVLKKLPSNSSKKYQNCLSDLLVEIFSRDATSLNNWSKIYQKNINATAIVLKYISDNWKSVSGKINKKALAELLNSFETVNEELLSKKKRDEALSDAVNAIRKVQEKMVAKKSSSSFGGFLKTCFIIAVIGTLSMIALDTRTKCIKGTVSKQLEPICTFGNQSYTKLAEGLNIIDEQIEKQVPNYKLKVKDASEPYIKLAKDLGLVSYNLVLNVKEYAAAKYPIVVKSIDSYAPGLIEETQRVASGVWSTSVVYCTRGYNFLKKEVFVGQLSPENMQRAVTEAFNMTQQKVTEYYFWLYEKVQTSIK